MSLFTKTLRVAHSQRNESRRMLGVLMEPLSFYRGADNIIDATEIITVPRGFITDGTSVPWVFWSAIPPWGSETSASVVHDWLYFQRDRSRAEADSVFLEGMSVLKTNVVMRNAAYLAVRVGGSEGYQNFYNRYFNDRIFLIWKSLDRNYDGDVADAILEFCKVFNFSTENLT